MKDLESQSKLCVFNVTEKTSVIQRDGEVCVRFLVH